MNALDRTKQLLESYVRISESLNEMPSSLENHPTMLYSLLANDIQISGIHEIVLSGFLKSVDVHEFLISSELRRSEQFDIEDLAKFNVINNAMWGGDWISTFKIELYQECMIPDIFYVYCIALGLINKSNLHEWRGSFSSSHEKLDSDCECAILKRVSYWHSRSSFMLTDMMINDKDTFLDHVRFSRSSQLENAVICMLTSDAKSDSRSRKALSMFMQNILFRKQKDTNYKKQARWQNEQHCRQ